MDQWPEILNGKTVLGGWDNLLVFWFVCHFNWHYSQNNRNTGESNFGCHRDISGVAARLLLTSLVSFNTFSPVIIYHKKSHLILTEWILCSKHGNLYNVTCAVLKRHSKCLFLFWTTHPARVIRFHSHFGRVRRLGYFSKVQGHLVDFGGPLVLCKDTVWWTRCCGGFINRIFVIHYKLVVCFE